MKQNSYRDCFFLPNELFQLGLDYGELAVYSFLKQCENRRTHYCWPQHPHHRCGGGHEYLTQQEYIPKNPMAAAPMIKKSNFMASQGKEDLPTSETVTIFTPEEIAKFKAEALQTWGNGTRIYQQAAAYTLMLNTGLRTGEALGLLNK